MTPVWAYFKIVSARIRMMTPLDADADAHYILLQAQRELRQHPAITVQVIQAAYRIAVERIRQEFPE